MLEFITIRSELYCKSHTHRTQFTGKWIAGQTCFVRKIHCWLVPKMEMRQQLSQVSVYCCLYLFMPFTILAWTTKRSKYSNKNILHRTLLTYHYHTCCNAAFHLDECLFIRFCSPQTFSLSRCLYFATPLCFGIFNMSHTNLIKRSPKIFRKIFGHC